ncbi:GNAT family N-acetyltransferase [Tessaracoccus oleiagri]|uniref:Putative acetyltransferase n=1 Tax=Tessaracoccus oleiagri TaxID=686624 RepID=A0A1G9JAQ0_9ACTN|nr:GNAT family N-acetyltransferase [Tessaracoccus oleiagri]SDL34620.1 putative acetyltransferase [Tessaracoccus oleiagri]
MTLTIEPADFADPALADFVQAHIDDMWPTAPPESQHPLSLEELQRPGVRLWVARLDGVLVGTAALSRMAGGDLELKTMRTEPAARGRGVGTALLERVLAEAGASGAKRVWLETGSMEFFAPARALYAKYGFVECGPFGDYGPDPNSTFMVRVL